MGFQQSLKTGDLRLVGFDFFEQAEPLLCAIELALANEELDIGDAQRGEFALVKLLPPA